MCTNDGVDVGGAGGTSAAMASVPIKHSITVPDLVFCYGSVHSDEIAAGATGANRPRAFHLLFFPTVRRGERGSGRGKFAANVRFAENSSRMNFQLEGPSRFFSPRLGQTFYLIAEYKKKGNTRPDLNSVPLFSN